MKSKNSGHDNLVPLPQRAKEAQREIRSKGGKVCAERKRQKKTMRELLSLAFEDIITNPTTKESKTRKELAMARLAVKCANGDLKAIELAAKLLGEAVVKHELTGADGTPIQMQAAPPQVLTAEQLAEAATQIEKDIQERLER